TVPRAAIADDDEPTAEGAASTPEPASAGSADSDAAQPAPSGKRKRRGKRRGARPIVSGRGVPHDQLRQDPRPRPSGQLHIKTVNGVDEAVVNLYNEDGSYD